MGLLGKKFSLMIITVLISVMSFVSCDDTIDNSIDLLSYKGSWVDHWESFNLTVDEINETEAQIQYNWSGNEPTSITAKVTITEEQDYNVGSKVKLEWDVVYEGEYGGTEKFCFYLNKERNSLFGPYKWIANSGFVYDSTLLVFRTENDTRFNKYFRKRPNTTKHTFNLVAPNAEKVSLVGDLTDYKKDKLNMIKDENGNWSITLYLKSGKWNYRFNVDGTDMLDPNNPVSKFDSSILEIGTYNKDNEVNPNIEHGEVETFTVENVTLQANANSSCNIYLPPGYNADNTSKNYSLLFLLHYNNGNKDTWTDENQGAIANYMDNLIARNEIDPFIIVMPSGGYSQYQNDVADFITGTLYDYIKANYNVKEGKHNTAIAGCSMGGFGALTLANENSEVFGLAMSMGGNLELYYIDQFKQTPLAVDFELVLYSGTEDPFYSLYKELGCMFNNAGVDYVSIAKEGNHGWHVWNEFTPDMLSRCSNFFKE